MKQPEELSAYKESVLQDIAQAQRVGADENAITALISQYPLDQALAARLARCYGPCREKATGTRSWPSTPSFWRTSGMTS